MAQSTNIQLVIASEKYREVLQHSRLQNLERASKI